MVAMFFLFKGFQQQKNQTILLLMIAVLNIHKIIFTS